MPVSTIADVQVLSAQVECIDGVSDKFYRIYVGEYTSGRSWCVYQWGRRGVLGQSKLESGWTLRHSEERAYSQLQSKHARGYRTTYDQLRLIVPDRLLLVGDTTVSKEALITLDAAFFSAAEAQWAAVLGLDTAGAPDQVAAVHGYRAASKMPGSARVLAELEAAWPHVRVPGGDILLIAMPKQQALLLACQTWGPWSYVELGGKLPKRTDALGVLDAAAALVGTMGITRSVEAGLLLVAS